MTSADIYEINNTDKIGHRFFFFLDQLGECLSSSRGDFNTYTCVLIDYFMLLVKKNTLYKNYFGVPILAQW